MGAALFISSSSATITNSKFNQCEVGVTVAAGANPIIQDCEMFDSNDYGIRVDNGSPSISNVLLDGNGSTNVGGIWIQAGTPSITSNTFHNNGNDGGIWIDAAVVPTIDGNTFSGNTRDIRAHPMILDDMNFDNNGLSLIHVDPKNITANTTLHHLRHPRAGHMN